MKFCLLFCLFLSNSVLAQTEWLKVGSAPTKYEMHKDSSSNITTLQSVANNISGFGAMMQNRKPDQYLGKRIRMSGYLKSKDVADWTGFWLRIDQAGSQNPLSFDNMNNRPIKGTTDWQKYDIVLDVPANASNIAFGVLLNGTGQVWIKNVSFEVADRSVPSTGAGMNQ